MKRFDHFIIGSVGVLLLLNACNQTTSGGNGSVVVPVTPTPPVTVVNGGTTLSKLQELIIDIREYTEKGVEGIHKGCGFVPTESFLTDMLARVAYVGDALTYARAICDAATQPLPQRAATARRLRTGVVVTLPTSINGVPIRGVFVR